MPHASTAGGLGREAPGLLIVVFTLDMTVHGKLGSACVLETEVGRRDVIYMRMFYVL